LRRFADFANGTPASFSQKFGDSVAANRVKNFFAFAQDDWKVDAQPDAEPRASDGARGRADGSQQLISNLNLDNHSAYGAAGAGHLD
jgi:hypothetical protein